MLKFFKCNNEGIVIPVTKCFTNDFSFEGVQEITPNEVEASVEKHKPVVTVSEETVTVNVGNVAHPMTEEHAITTVILETQTGGQYRYLPHDSEPVVQFRLAKGEKALAAYAYCNLHGLWKAEIDS